MKTVSYVLILFSFLISCQKEKLLPDIYLTYELAPNGFLEGQFVLNNASYQVDYGDESPVEKGTAINYAAFNIQHKYLRKGTFTLLITVTNNSDTYQYRRKIKVSQLAYPIVEDFKYMLGGNGGIGVNFLVNDGDMYELDFGDGQVIKDSLNNNELPENYQMVIAHVYKKIGNYKIRLTISNIEGKASSEQTINIAYIPPPVIADFSYEVLENGRLKLKNLSQNATAYKWAISDFSNPTPVYISNKKDIDVIIDLKGRYTIKLMSTEGVIEKELVKTIDINTARNQMEFSGTYKSEKVSGSLESNGLFYVGSFSSGDSTGAPLKYMGLYQYLAVKTAQSDLAPMSSTYNKFYPIFPYPTNLGTDAPAYRLESRYLALKKYLVKPNDSDIISVTEEDLDPIFYNNISTIYAKAFWIKYKVKNDILDGEMKVRLLIRGYK